MNTSVHFLEKDVRRLCVLLLLVAACESAAPDPAPVVPCSPVCGPSMSCLADRCVCELGFNDCDGVRSNGCERAGPCVCRGGETQSCYSGSSETRHVGLCSDGLQRCVFGEWGLCHDEVLPRDELCETNAKDEDCDGLVDEDDDLDGDGFGRCSGDCCDDLSQCFNPAAINPAAYDFPDNNSDDDCDGTADNAQALCPEVSLAQGASAESLAVAMELCQTSSDDTRRWGLLSAELRRADGEGRPEALQSAVFAGLGDGGIPPRNGDSLAILATGMASGVGDEGFIGDNSLALSRSPVSAPAIFLDAHGGELSTNSACPSATGLVYDSIQLRLRLRVPSNAQGFSYDFRFWSREYPNFLCTRFNDFFVALLDSQHPLIPADRNISFDVAGDPVSINSAFFSTCHALSCGDPIQWGLRPTRDTNDDGCVDSLFCDEEQTCSGPLGSCSDGAEELEFYVFDSRHAGATSWLRTSAPVVPGEIITLEFHLWDTSDGHLDSMVLLDNFRWLTPEPSLDTKR
jgi:hypothetical protein